MNPHKASHPILRFCFRLIFFVIISACTFPPPKTPPSGATVTPTKPPPTSAVTRTSRPTASPLPTLTRRPTPTLTPTPRVRQFSLNGEGDFTSQPFSLPSGDTLFYWAYDGAEGEFQARIRANTNHQREIYEIQTWRDDRKRDLLNRLDRALKKGDQFAVIQLRESLAQLEKDFNAKVNRENQRFRAEMDGILTRFTVILRQPKHPDKILAESTGRGASQTVITVTAGDDYILTITATGPWTIQVIPNPLP